MSAETQVGDDQDLIINLDEPAIQPEGGTQAEKPPPVPGPKTTLAPQGALAELEKQIEAERRERQRVTTEALRLQRERDELAVYARDAEKRDASNYEQQCESYINSGQQQMEALGAQYESALSDGDFKEASDINRKIARLSGQIAVLERDKTIWKQQRDQRIAAQQRQPQQQAREAKPVDPLERAIQGRTEPTKAFLRKHTDLIRGDGTLKRVAVEAHEKALDAGMQVDTDAYFHFIEQTLSVSSPGGNVVRQPQGAPTMAAPISRSSAPGSGGNGTFVMSPKMRRLAEEQGVTPHEWANNYIRLLKEGKVTPIT